MSKLKNIAELCNLLMETKHGISVNSLRCRLNIVNERTVYRYIKDVNDMVGVFGYQLEESKRYGKRAYRLIKKQLS